MTITYRVGTPDDTPDIFEVFIRTLADLERREGTPDADNMWTDPAFIRGYREQRFPLFEHLASTADQFWIAERDHQVVAYARSTLHDGVRDLTEFFVLPAHQAEGVGRELLARAFPTEGARLRTIIATTDIRALSRYLKSGVSPRFPIYAFSGKPRPVDVTTDLTFEPVTPGPEALAALRSIDQEVLGLTRDADHAFLLGDRRAHFYRRGGRTVGYGYGGNGTGPIALLEASDYPAVLAHAETESAARGETSFRMSVPLVNRAAAIHLLERGFRLEAFPLYLMSDEPFGTFDRYIMSSPPLFL